MSDKEEDDKLRSAFMTETSNIDASGGSKQPPVHSARSGDDNEDAEGEDYNPNDQEEEENDDEHDEDGDDDYNEYEEYGEDDNNPFYQYASNIDNQNQNAQKKAANDDDDDGEDENEVQDEIRPLSAVAPKIFHQDEAQVEISSTPAFQCLEEVCTFCPFSSFLS
jgi:hypothetical protein